MSHTVLPPLHQSAEGAHFPVGFYLDFLVFLAAHRDRFSLLTYDDFYWEDDHNEDARYPDEWQRWQTALRTGERDPNKIHLLIHYDADMFPQRTTAFLQEELRLGLRSNVMTFARYEYLEYVDGLPVFHTLPDHDIDRDQWAEFARQGFCFGYHCNAYECAAYDPRLASRFFEDDVAALRRYFPVHYYSPHGGCSSLDGTRNNYSLALPESLRTSMRLICNTASPTYNGVWTDGGLDGPDPDPVERDLRDWIVTLQPGGRYRLVIHPQYYSEQFTQLKRYHGVRWYEEVVANYARGRTAWADVTLPALPPTTYHFSGRSESTTMNVDTATEQPIFVHEVSRSGGTLMVTILDAHPEIAMSYELYPHMLSPLKQRTLDVAGFRRMIHQPPTEDELARDPSLQNVFAWIIHCKRSGFDGGDLEALLDEYLADGYRLNTEEDMLRWIEHLAKEKMRRTGKTRWGVRNDGITAHADVYPRGRYLTMVRDGRDVLASQLTTGAFNPDPARFARNWRDSVRNWRGVSAQYGLDVYEVFYERLVEDPEAELRRICEFIDVPYMPQMLTYYQQDLTVFKAGHISLDRISRPIDATQVGRYRRDLTPTQLAAFTDVAGQMLVELGYNCS